MSELLNKLNRRQLKALMRYCWLYSKPLNEEIVSRWIAHRAKRYR